MTSRTCVYNRTGIMIDKSIEGQTRSTVKMSNPPVDQPANEKFNQLVSQQDSLDDIKDFIDENENADISQNIGKYQRLHQIR